MYVPSTSPLIRFNNNGLGYDLKKLLFLVNISGTVLIFAEYKKLTLLSPGSRNVGRSDSPALRSRDQPPRDSSSGSRQQDYSRRWTKPTHKSPRASYARNAEENTPQAGRSRGPASTPEAPKKSKPSSDREDDLERKNRRISKLEEDVIEKDKDIKAKKKEITALKIDIGTLKKKKEKEGTLKINENLVKKNEKLKNDISSLKAAAYSEPKKKVKEESSNADEGTQKLIEERDLEIKALKKDLARVRNDRDDRRKEVKEKEVIHKAAITNLEDEISKLEDKFHSLKLEPKEHTKSVKTSSDDVDSNDDSKVEDNKPAAETDDSDKSEVFTKSKKRKINNKSSSINKKQKNYSSNTLPSDGGDFNDDSFNNILPVSDNLIGRNTVKNFEDKKNHIKKPIEAVNESNKDFSVTTLNKRISFFAVGRKARQNHDVSRFGVKPCGLQPFCSNILRGGEEIGLAYICAPTSNYHKYFERNTWVCWYHCQASIDGHHVQTQCVNKEAVTPNDKKTKEPEQAAPTKAPLTKDGPANDAKNAATEPEKSSRINLEERLNAPSSESEEDK